VRFRSSSPTGADPERDGRRPLIPQPGLDDRDPGADRHDQALGLNGAEPEAKPTLPPRAEPLEQRAVCPGQTMRSISRLLGLSSHYGRRPVGAVPAFAAIKLGIVEDCSDARVCRRGARRHGRETHGGEGAHVTLID
jgi:hypothetical protein